MTLETIAPTVKASDIPWLGEIPKEWEIKSLKYIANLKSGETIKSEMIEQDGLFPVYGGNGLRGYFREYTHNGNYILIGRQGALCGNIHYAEGKFWASEHAIVVSPIVQYETNWLGELLRGMNLNQYSVSAAQPGLSIENINKLKIPFPKVEEQKWIAHFLDRKTAAIATLIAKKQRLIQLLEEKRTALINQAVTKGLNPDAPMKDSGIPWIGDIPKHWDVTRLKWKKNYVDQGRSPVCANRLADDEEWGVLKVGCVNGGVFNELEHKAFPENLLKDFEHDIYKFEVQPGDILISRANTKELVGSAARVGSVRPKLMLSDKLYRLHLNGKVDSEFLILSLNSRLARCQFERESSGASGSMQNISQDKLSDLLLPFPPSQTEQIEINQIFQERSLALQSPKLKLFDQIEKLQEYRRSLITAAVTGKLNIPEVTSDASYSSKQLSNNG